MPDLVWLSRQSSPGSVSNLRRDHESLYELREKNEKWWLNCLSFSSPGGIEFKDNRKNII